MNLLVGFGIFLAMLVLGLAILGIVAARTGWSPVAALSRPFMPAAPAAPASAAA